MPMTPAEEIENRRKAGEGMVVPIPARASGTVLIEGPGMPTKVGIGAPDLPVETWLSITNRFLPADGGAYDRVRRVHAGMLALHERPLQGPDHHSGRHGLTIREGELGPDDRGMEEGGLEDAVGEPPDETYAWRVVDSAGRNFVLTIGAPGDSFDIADGIRRFMRGPFHVARLEAATFTAAEELAVPGWTLAVEPRALPRPAPRIGGLRRL